MPEYDYDSLRRTPDVEAENLHAYDASDRYLIDDAAELLAAVPEGRLVVIGDRYGALTLGAAAAGARGIRVHQDDLVGELALASNAERDGFSDYRSLPLGPELLDGAELILLQLPRALDTLDEIAGLAARHAAPGARLIAGGRIKHMSPAMNGVIGAHFDSVEASLARQKSRLLRASGPRPSGSDDTYPKRAFHEEIGLWACAHGAAFGGTELDIGTRFLLAQLDRLPEIGGGTAIDLGCGTGLIACSLAAALPEARIIASDQASSAVDSARATAAANGLAERIEVVRDNGLDAQPDASASLIALNPPFHIGASVHTGAALKMFADAGRVLEPGGQLWTVWNAHLAYRGALERLVGPTEQVARNNKFVVTRSVRGTR